MNVDTLQYKTCNTVVPRTNLLHAFVDDRVCLNITLQEQERNVASGIMLRAEDCNAHFLNEGNALLKGKPGSIVVHVDVIK